MEYTWLRIVVVLLALFVGNRANLECRSPVDRACRWKGRFVSFLLYVLGGVSPSMVIMPLASNGEITLLSLYCGSLLGLIWGSYRILSSFDTDTCALDQSKESCKSDTDSAWEKVSDPGRAAYDLLTTPIVIYWSFTLYNLVDDKLLYIFYGGVILSICVPLASAVSPHRRDRAKSEAPAK